MPGQTSDGSADPSGALLAGGEAERRQLTVLFCDMVGSTKTAEALDAEVLLGILGEYHGLVAKMVEHFGGSVAEYAGDGVVAYFGYPNAHEDDANRAVRAGLAITELAAEKSPELEAKFGERLSVRIGIHTGSVVVGEIGSGKHKETRAVGVTTSVAARIQAAADPDTVVISPATLRLARGVFVTEDLGPHDLKGIANPVRLHRVIGPTGASTPLDVASIEGLTPFVGRAHELSQMLQQWNQSTEGRGQIVMLEGEGGMGKSRLVREFRSRLTDKPHRWIECRASNLHSHTAFHPLSNLIKETLGLRAAQSAKQQLSSLEQKLSEMGLEPSETAPLFANLLAIPMPGHQSPFAVTVDARRRLTLEALTSLVLALAEPEPVVLVVEDLHWLDSSTLDWLGLLMQRVSNAPVLLLPTFRPSFEPPWALGANAIRVTLEALSHEQTDVMMMGITGGSALPSAVRDQVVEKTDGVPLFVEEFTQAVLESGALEAREDRYEETGPVPSFTVPATLQDSLMARLDRLGPAKNVAQRAAVLGRDFSYSLLAAVATDALSLERDLSLLVAAGILQRTGDRAETSYTFKHTLIQETAYHSLLKATRRGLHARIANTMERDFAASATAEPERLAWHCEQGGLIEKAVRYYQSASDQSQRRSAAAESIRHLSRGIELLDALPEGISRRELELQLQIELGKTVVAAEGWGNADAEAAYQRARELCEDIGELPQVFQVIRGLVIYYTAKSELRTANELAKRLTQLAEESGEPDLLLPTHMQLGILHYYDGNPSAAVGQFEKAIALYEPSAHEHLTQLYGEDLGVLARIWMAWSQWLLGRPDEALATCREAQALGEQIGHQFSLACVFLWTSVLLIMRREPQRARDMAELSTEISERHGFALLLSEGRLMVAWSRLQQPLDESKMQVAAMEFQSCVNEVSGTGMLANAPVMVGFLADAYHHTGQHPMALGAVEGALAISMTTGQAQWDAELHRLKGEFLLHAHADEDDVERLFRRALEIGQNQNALSLELRAGVSLGRLLQKQGRADQARELLAPVYAQFVEGFDCPDLIDARELLED